MGESRSPTAITLAQITSSAAGDTFEILISRTLFVSYAILTCVSSFSFRRECGG